RLNARSQIHGERTQTSASQRHQSFVTLPFFNSATATIEIYTLSLHDALPILDEREHADDLGEHARPGPRLGLVAVEHHDDEHETSEEHTSELQSPCNLVCRLLPEQKKMLNIAPHCI